MKYGPYVCDQCLSTDALLYPRERQNSSESHKLKHYGARNQFRAAQFVTVSFIGCSKNAMDLVANTTLKMTVQLWKIVVWDHSDHQFWTPYMCSMTLDRCSPVFSVRDKNFQKVTNWSTLVLEISSEQRDLWPFGLLDVVWTNWNKWSGISVWVVQGPQKAEIWH